MLSIIRQYFLKEPLTFFFFHKFFDKAQKWLEKNDYYSHGWDNGKEQKQISVMLQSVTGSLNCSFTLMSFKQKINWSYEKTWLCKAFFLVIGTLSTSSSTYLDIRIKRMRNITYSSKAASALLAFITPPYIILF